VAALPAVLALGVAAFVFVRVQHSLDQADISVAAQGRFPFELRTIGKLENLGFEAIASPANSSSGAFYRGKLYLGGGSGLSVYDVSEDGYRLLRSYRLGLELPAAPLGQMVVARLRGESEPELVIATAGQGVLLFSGNGSADGAGTIRQIWARDAAARNVRALLPLPSGELLIGTERRGLLVYRGSDKTNAMETFHPQFAGLSVTALAADATGFWVGTRDRGVLHWHGGQVDAFGGEGRQDRSNDPANGGTETSALPDDQVDAIAVHGDRVFVGTPLGVEEFDQGQPVRVLAKNTFAQSLFADDTSLTIGSMDQGIRHVSLEGSRRLGLIGRSAYQSERTDDQALAFLRQDADAASPIYAVMRDGLRREQSDGQWSRLGPAAGAADGDSTTLTDGNISALAFGPDGRLWVGYFDRGIDIFPVDGVAALGKEHREDDHLFCINRIVLDPRRNTMAVATANGLVLFDAQTSPRQVMTKRDGLIADDVTDIAFAQEIMVLATPAGLTFVDGGGVSSLYGFQGLVNNHVYALGWQPQSTELLAGTLGGISVVKNESVEHNMTATNSGLKHNWITAIVPVNAATASGPDVSREWMVGTYGAGVMLLGKDGRFTPMEGATSDMVVNPNAMIATNAHIFAGTLGKGLWIWSRTSGRWRQITAGLPSENITALAAHAGEVYVGTENGLVRIAERLLE
jgi:ligand-binding sensor domain-containing protein